MFFILYLLILFYFLFFAEMLGRTDAVREYHYNLIPLKEIKRFWVYRENLGFKAVFLNLAGNVLAFMPFGYFVPKLSRKGKSIFFGTLMGFELSLFVELCQLAFQLGSFDVDDILLNTIGAFLGYVCHWILLKIEKRKKG